MQLRRDHQEFINRGYVVVAIGHGTALRAAKYRQYLNLPFPILADRHQRAYEAYGLGRAAYADFVNPKLYPGGIRAVLARSRFSRPSGDTQRLPGTSIVDRTGIIRYANSALIAGDLTPITKLITWIDTGLRKA